MGKGRTKPAVMPIDRTGEDRPLLFVGWIDALPVPAALIRPMARGNFRLHASNAAFDRLTLSPAGADAPIEMLRALLTSQPLTRDYKAQWKYYGEVPGAK